LVISPFYKRLKAQLILPILRMQDPSLCLDFCKVLREEGFGLLEITLTTPDALALIQELAQQGFEIGAGTVLNLAEAEKAVAAGARYLVAPGLCTRVAGLAHEAGVPYLPGVYTAGEVMQALQLGLTQLKFFPAQPLGPEYLKHLSGPFPQIHWLPTGGIEFEQIPSWLSLPLLGIGQGSRLVSAQALHSQNWQAIREELQDIQARIQIWQAQPGK